MNKEMYEKHIEYLENENTMLRDEIARFQAKVENSEKKALIEKGEMLKKIVLFLNVTYGRMGEIQASLLNELNSLNNANLVTTNERMMEALKIVNQLLPLSTDDGE